MAKFSFTDIIVGTYPTYEEACKVAEQKSHFWAGFIGIRTTKKGFTVYCSL